MRSKFSYIGGIGCFFLLMFLAYHLANYLELRLDSDLGIIVTLLAGMLGHKVFIFIQQIEPRYEDQLTSNCWIFGLTLTMILTALIYKAFEHTYSDSATYLRLALQLCSIAGTVWVCKQIYANKLAQYELKLKQMFEIENNK